MYQHINYTNILCISLANTTQMDKSDPNLKTRDLCIYLYFSVTGFGDFPLIVQYRHPRSPNALFSQVSSSNNPTSRNVTTKFLTLFCDAAVAVISQYSFQRIVLFFCDHHSITLKYFRDQLVSFQ